MSLSFVNIHGQPVDVTPTAKAKSSRPQRDEQHKGFLAVGFSPEYLERTRQHHEALIANAKAAGGVPPKPWDEDLFMSSHPPGKVRSKPYELREAAEQACLMAERQAGWKRCRVVPVIRK